MNLHIGLPEMLMLILIAWGFTITAVKHGKPRNEEYNAKSSALGLIVMLILLYWGGFFS